VKSAILPSYLDEIFPRMLDLFSPQKVVYNGGIANVKEWKISCYLEVMSGGVPTTNPNLELRDLFLPLLETCDKLFIEWYRQQKACNNNSVMKKMKVNGNDGELQVNRLMTFITRYTPNPGEQALLKHIDGAGKVDGSVVIALPMDRWSSTLEVNSFDGHGGGLTFWDGRGRQEIHYDTRVGDVCFIDRAVWHQADPITKGTRWALVIFYTIQ